MFGACGFVLHDLKQSFRPILSISRSFSCSRPNQGVKAVKFLKSQRKRQANLARQSELSSSIDAVDPVLGRRDTPFINRVVAELREPGVLSHGYEYNEVEKLMSALESTKRRTLELSSLNSELVEPESLESLEARREAISRILSMRNADNKNLLKMALKLAREEFQRFPGDTGSSEVQAACMTIRIHNLVKHIKDHQKDFANIRILRMLVQQRQRILRYLKRDNPERYYWTLEKLGLTDSVVMQEFNMDRRYMQDFKMFGDKILVKDSKKVADQKRREMRKQRRVANVSV
ncbi:hypothetical protein ZYGR_0AF02020 [Zygosaccharomyces rouxii]|uniref:37S ribosomal protein S28, mitochondrial n=1 Tax=Zygosaccharomyces rouxii TaxID=4956 RepID=A0A1Q3A7U3_ZYGRO|nr:hypothetical protein ZYGR_0AF02020 [Zygosaccharomyces rouxii]